MQFTKNNKKLFVLVLTFTLLTGLQSQLKRLNPSGNINSQVAGLILTIHDGGSYDNLFTQVKQKSIQGSVVLTYSADVSSQKNIFQALNQNFRTKDSVLGQFSREFFKLAAKCPSCIVFNWQCSSGYGDESFNSNLNSLKSLLQLIIKGGYMAMFSDFSLKALIHQWDQNILGENPFIKVGQTNDAIKLKFDKAKLLSSPSSQLQTIGKIARTNQLMVNVLGGTITYAVDLRICPSDKYSLQVLTIASNFPAPQPYLQSKIGQATGLAGHVLLKYKDGGKILTSMGHWIELMRIDTSVQQLFKIAQNYGTSQVAKITAQYNALSNQSQRTAYIAQQSKSYILSSSPGQSLASFSSATSNLKTAA